MSAIGDARGWLRICTLVGDCGSLGYSLFYNCTNSYMNDTKFTLSNVKRLGSVALRWMDREEEYCRTNMDNTDR